MQRYTSRISFRDISKNSMLAGATLTGKLRTRWLARGNLLVDGGGEPGEFAELPEGGNELISIKLNATIADPEGVASDGKYFAICDQEQKPRGRADFRGNAAKQRSVTHFISCRFA
jgi:hypothetical protein